MTAPTTPRKFAYVVHSVTRSVSNSLVERPSLASVSVEGVKLKCPLRAFQGRSGFRTQPPTRSIHPGFFPAINSSLTTTSSAGFKGANPTNNGTTPRSMSS